MTHIFVRAGSRFSQVGMTKNGDQTLASSTWAEIGPCTPDAGSAVVGNALRANGTGNATIFVGSEWSMATTNKNWRVLRNGVVIWTKGSVTGAILSDSFPIAVADGDLFTCEGWVNSGVVANRVVLAGVNTFLRIVPT